MTETGSHTGRQAEDTGVGWVLPSIPPMTTQTASAQGSGGNPQCCSYGELPLQEDLLSILLLNGHTGKSPLSDLLMPWTTVPRITELFTQNFLAKDKCGWSLLFLNCYKGCDQSLVFVQDSKTNSVSFVFFCLSICLSYHVALTGLELTT